MEDLVDLLHGQAVTCEPDFAVHPLWPLHKRPRARPADVRRADDLVLAVRVGVEGVLHGDGSAHLEQEGRVGQEVLHELHGAEEGVSQCRKGLDVSLDLALDLESAVNDSPYWMTTALTQRRRSRPSHHCPTKSRRGA